MTELREPFKNPTGKAKFMAVYQTSLDLWPVPYEEFDILTRFGCTHVIASGPKEAPPLVLLHGYFATATMWSPNIAELSDDYRVYALDVMGQPSKSVPDQLIRTRQGFAEWLAAVFNGLSIEKACLAGMSYGGWLALNFAILCPDRVEKLILLSPAACFLPLVSQFYARVMPLIFFPVHFGVNNFMGWMTYKENLKDAHMLELYQRIVDLMYLGMKYFRMQSGVPPIAFADEELRGMEIPTLLLVGQQEVIYDPAAALECARRLIPHIEADLIQQASHDMVFSQSKNVNQRIMKFLRA
ncbi:MAG: alpha/beta hydrolase [Chloroflexota bacterium]|nr:MAG: alpha/beta hydrolase [Chloroflexota bacterium]